MSKKGSVLLYIYFSLLMSLTAQNFPQVTYDGSQRVRLKSLSVDVEIVGNYATTTYNMEFYNELNRILEGQLSFPLSDGQSVTNFALEVNGKMRNAAVVEKEKARVAYETIIRRKVDPGLLEKTQGNNYKARIYPIFARNSKKVSITYEEELSSTEQKYVYTLPLGLDELVSEFNLNINVTGSEPKIIKDTYGINFLNQSQSYCANLESTEIKISEPVKIEMTKTVNGLNKITDGDIFYVSGSIDLPLLLKQKPDNITVLWDRSYSHRKVDLEKTFNFFDLYFNDLQNVKIDFITFNNRIQKKEKIDISNGEWGALKEIIQRLTYDGGTSFASFDKVNKRKDAYLLFTDGMDNLGAFSTDINAPIYTFNSTRSSNPLSMRLIAEQTNGQFINLNKISSAEGLKLISTNTLQFLGIAPNKNIKNVYPNKPINISSDFAIAGHFSDNTEVELLFGINGEVTHQMKATLDKKEQTKLAKRLWAKTKLASLLRNKTENKQKIIDLAVSHHLITDYTSMIVLELASDYAKYNIEPPAELKNEYNRLIAYEKLNEDKKLKEAQLKMLRLMAGYDQLKEWYKTKPISMKELISKKQLEDTIAYDVTINNRILTTGETHFSPTIDSVLVDKRKDLISGYVISSSGTTLQLASVVNVTQNKSTSTDFEGWFAIEGKENDLIEVTYVGYPIRRLNLTKSPFVRIFMKEPNDLDDIVVIGYKKPLIEVDNASSGGVVTADEISNLPVRDLSEIASSTAGVASEQNMDDDIRIRGARSDDNGYVIDGGPPVSGNNIPQTEVEEEVIEFVEWNGSSPNNKSVEIQGPIILNYMQKIKRCSNSEQAYLTYLSLRKEYVNSPSFFIEVSNHFYQIKEVDKAITVLTTIAELKIEDYELLKALGYQLEYYGAYEEAAHAYKKVLELRPEEPQSYRDLALIYTHLRQYQKSFDLLYKIYSGQLLVKDKQGRYDGIENIVSVELNRLVSKYGDKIDLTKKQQEIFKSMPLGLRIVIDWNHNNTDIDLHIVDPNGEEASYKNNRTLIGGHVSNDLTDGLGPEEFLLKSAIKGKYQIKVNYFGDQIQKISGPTILKVTTFKHYGTKNEISTIKVIRLSKNDNNIMVGEVVF